MPTRAGHPSPDPQRSVKAGLEQRQINWTQHWATGAAHSCVGSFGEAYEGAIAQFWHATFSAMAADSRVLDLATGGGALPRLLMLARPQLDWTCDGVDLALNQPPWWAALNAQRAQILRFHGNCHLEALPLVDGQFDLVISQYGFEYADMKLSLAEAMRVLAPRGRLALVMHHAESRPVSLAETELLHIDWLLSPQGLLAATKPMLDLLAQAATPQGRAALDSDANACRARDLFNAAQDAVSERVKAPDGADILFECRNSVAAAVQLALAQQPHKAEQQLENCMSALTDARWRLQELRQHALSSVAANDLAQRLVGQGYKVELKTLAQGEHLMGWALKAIR